MQIYLRDIRPAIRAPSIDEALQAALDKLSQPSSTADVVEVAYQALVKKLDLATGDPAEARKDRLVLATVLAGKAHAGHPQAVRSAQSFRRYGREMRPWNWVPAGKPEAVIMRPTREGLTDAEDCDCVRKVARMLFAAGYEEMSFELASVLQPEGPGDLSDIIGD